MSYPRPGQPFDAVLAAQLRQILRERGPSRVSAECGLTPATLASAAAAGHVLDRSAARLEDYLREYFVENPFTTRALVPPGGQATPGRVT